MNAKWTDDGSWNELAISSRTISRNAPDARIPTNVAELSNVPSVEPSNHARTDGNEPRWPILAAVAWEADAVATRLLKLSRIAEFHIGFSISDGWVWIELLANQHAFLNGNSNVTNAWHVSTEARNDTIEWCLVSSSAHALRYDARYGPSKRISSVRPISSSVVLSKSSVVFSVNSGSKSH